MPTGNERGLALDTAETFAGDVPVSIRFNYVSWGGNGADGITVFLYDATQNMSGAANGGGLGYCGGAGGYLGIGMDEYGNFSNPADHCGAAGGGPGFRPGYPRDPRPDHRQRSVCDGCSGRRRHRQSLRRHATLCQDRRRDAHAGDRRLYRHCADTDRQQPAVPDAVLQCRLPVRPAGDASRVGFTGSTGGSTNIHELQGLITATPDDLQVALSGPATVLQGTPVTYTLTLTNNGAYPIGASDAPTLTDALPAVITGATWTCTPSAGATCTASGSGSLSTSTLTLPSNASVTYTITGTLDPAIICGTTVSNTASADFGSSSSFIDPDPTNNSATATSNVSCAVTLAANPGTLSFGPQTVGAPGSAQTIILTGTNGATITNVATSGDFSQTNDCSAALSGSSCTIQVVFTPTAEGSRAGTLTITSSAASSPTTVTLSGTGTNAVPGKFTFVPLNNVAPSSMQVSNPITVTGTNVPTTISVSGGAQYSINGGAYTSTPGVVPPGAQITVRVPASPSYGTTVTAVVTIGGVAASFTVTTQPPPQLQDVTVTSGGGSVSPLMLAALGLLLLMRIRRAQLTVAAALLLVLAAGLSGRPAAAADWDSLRSGFYSGGGLGDVTSTLTAGKVTDRLQADGYQVVASHVDRSSLSASLYVGHELSRHLALEFGWSYLGRTRTTLQRCRACRTCSSCCSMPRGSRVAAVMPGHWWVATAGTCGRSCPSICGPDPIAG